ncbi:MAG: patatin-like phospholipase family protein [Acidimicrobiia bacterium]|nr:patatin-like phospholipase family protein [Acidimicrobiia bacterium]
MSKVGLVLGGGGITGAAFQFGALLTLQLATGWNPNNANVVIGTSCGALTGAMVRGDQLSLQTFIGNARSRHEVADVLRDRVFRRSRPSGVVRWMRRGVLPGLRRPDLNLVLGSPSINSTEGIAEWVEGALGDLADTWPDHATVIVAYDLQDRKRVAFGTEEAPPARLKNAVAASTAVPFVFQPVLIRDKWYADGGIASGTSVDLLLGAEQALDLVIVVAPLAAAEKRPGAKFYEDIFDRFGRTALEQEVALVKEHWPETDFLILRPDHRVLAAARPNPMSAEAAMPAFLRTLRSMKHELAAPATWDLLKRHIVVGSEA